MPLAAIKKLSKVYQMPGGAVAVHALRGIDIDFIEGESVAICGASGSGKSTLLNILGCLDRPSSGQYILGDTDVSGLDDDSLSEVRGKKVGFVFQNFNLIAQLTVLENVEVPLFYQGVPPADRRIRALKYLEMLGLQDRTHHRPMQLSGGQQQRVAIARSLMNEPLILLADEPTGNLDTATGEMVLSIFDELHAQGRTVIIITHEPDVAQRCDRIITLRDGQIISDEYTGHGATNGRRPPNPAG